MLRANIRQTDDEPVFSSFTGFQEEVEYRGKVYTKKKQTMKAKKLLEIKAAVGYADKYLDYGLQPLFEEGVFKGLGMRKNEIHWSIALLNELADLVCVTQEKEEVMVMLWREVRQRLDRRPKGKTVVQPSEVRRVRHKVEEYLSSLRPTQQQLEKMTL